MTAYRLREITPLLPEALKSLPVVVVTGLRQAGKTTLLATDPAFAGRRYLTLDDLATLEAAERDPEALIAGDEPVTVDEVQRSPGLLLAVKRAVDRRREPGRFLLSGFRQSGAPTRSERVARGAGPLPDPPSIPPSRAPRPDRGAPLPRSLPRRAEATSLLRSRPTLGRRDPRRRTAAGGPGGCRP